MNLLDIVKIGGASGAAGLLLGIGLVTWVRPETSRGSLFLILVAVCLVSLFAAVVTLLWRLAFRQDPKAPPE